MSKHPINILVGRQSWRIRAYSQSNSTAVSFSRGWFACFYRQLATEHLRNARIYKVDPPSPDAIRVEVKMARDFWHQMLREQFPKTLLRAEVGL